VNDRDPNGLRTGMRLSPDAVCRDSHARNQKSCIVSQKKLVAAGPIDPKDQKLLQKARRDPIAMAIAAAPFAVAAAPAIASVGASAVSSAGFVGAANVCVSLLSLCLGPANTAISDSPVPDLPEQPPTQPAPNFQQDTEQLFKDINDYLNGH
jgi:hypothetical protein